MGKFLCGTVFSSFGYIPRGGNARSQGNAMFNILKYRQRKAFLKFFFFFLILHKKKETEASNTVLLAACLRNESCRAICIFKNSVL